MVSVVRFIPMTCYVRVVVWFTKLPHKSLQAVHSLSMVSEVMDRYSALAGRLTIWFSLRFCVLRGQCFTRHLWQISDKGSVSINGCPGLRFMRQASRVLVNGSVINSSLSTYWFTPHVSASTEVIQSYTGG